MILVTGATGFLGAELARQLVTAGEHIKCIKREHSVIPSLLEDYKTQITWLDADLLDFNALEDAFEGVLQVYHCAAWVSFNPADKKPMIKTNVEGTANIVNLCMQFGARLLHVSSIAAIGEARPGALINENNHLEESPYENPYAISKYESEMEVWRGIAEGLNAVIVNPSLIIGASAGATGSGKIFAKVQSGLKFHTSGSCGLVDVVDVCLCMIKLMNTDIKAQRYIINAENYKYKTLFNEAANNFGAAPPQMAAKEWMLELGWRISSTLSVLFGKPIGIDKISAQAASKNLNYDNSKIKAAIGFEFKPIKKSISEICDALIALAVASHKSI